MTALANSAQSITATAVPGNLRMSALPTYFPTLFFLFEASVYEYFEKFSKDYHGGYWEFMRLDNHGFYMSLVSDQTFEVRILDNYFEETMSADAASIVANLYAMNTLSNRFDCDRTADMYHKLRLYAYEHVEASKILSAID